MMDTLLSFVTSKYNIRESSSSVEISTLTHSHTAMKGQQK